ncbi:nucleoprotein TPR [Cimex lectularius]|uniref:Nucleoprotein TPR n=1 Tax=Cimex lectularius TaxID=79782 RepID=A0A8I6TE62_CIMLE|nr:nucleoprotein TPR [Cimex lectularius]
MPLRKKKSHTSNVMDWSKKSARVTCRTGTKLSKAECASPVDLELRTIQNRGVNTTESSCKSVMTRNALEATVDEVQTVRRKPHCQVETAATMTDKKTHKKPRSRKSIEKRNSYMKELRSLLLGDSEDNEDNSENATDSTDTFKFDANDFNSSTDSFNSDNSFASYGDNLTETDSLDTCTFETTYFNDKVENNTNEEVLDKDKTVISDNSPEEKPDSVKDAKSQRAFLIRKAALKQDLMENSENYGKSKTKLRQIIKTKVEKMFDGLAEDNFQTFEESAEDKCDISNQAFSSLKSILETHVDRIAHSMINENSTDGKVDEVENSEDTDPDVEESFKSIERNSLSLNNLIDYVMMVKNSLGEPMLHSKNKNLEMIDLLKDLEKTPDSSDKSSLNVPNVVNKLSSESNLSTLSDISIKSKHSDIDDISFANVLKDVETGRDCMNKLSDELLEEFCMDPLNSPGCSYMSNDFHYKMVNPGNSDYTKIDRLSKVSAKSTENSVKTKCNEVNRFLHERTKTSVMRDNRSQRIGVKPIIKERMENRTKHNQSKVETNNREIKRPATEKCFKENKTKMAKWKSDSTMGFVPTAPVDSSPTIAINTDEDQTPKDFTITGLSAQVCDDEKSGVDEKVKKSTELVQSETCRTERNEATSQSETIFNRDGCFGSPEEEQRRNEEQNQHFKKNPRVPLKPPLEARPRKKRTNLTAGGTRDKNWFGVNAPKGDTRKNVTQSEMNVKIRTAKMSPWKSDPGIGQRLSLDTGPVERNSEGSQVQNQPQSPNSNEMDAEGSQALLFKAVDKEEFEKIESPLREKIEAVLNEHIDGYLTAKACFVSTKISQEEKIKDLEEQVKNVKQERDDYKIKLDALTTQFDETSKRLAVTNVQVNKLREEVQRLEKSVETVRHERDEAVDEKQIASNALERREMELDRLRDSVTALNADLRVAVAARCEAVSQAEDVQAKQLELEFKEKRFESERTLLNQQIIQLTADLGRANDELMKQRREATTSMIALQTKITEKEEELKISKDQFSKLQEINSDMMDRLEELGNKLKTQVEKENAIITNFESEVKSQTKLADLYKERLEESENRSVELSGAVKELQRLLQEASEQHGILETKLSQQEQDTKATLKAKQEAISALKEELRHANILLEAVKQESSEAAVSRLSPMAASASKLLKSGLTLTQLYTKYAEVSQELIVYKNENEHMREYMAKVLDDINEKVAVLKKQEEDYTYAVESMEMLNKKVEDLESEQSKLMKEKGEAEATAAYLLRENKRLNGSVSDLGRQVCFLLREVEAARGNHVPLHDDPEKSKADVVTTSDVISKHLVTFSDIQELQLTNQKLLAALREISQDKEEVEMGRESEQVVELKGEIERAKAKVTDLQEREKFLEKELEVIKSQRDVYQRLFKQQNKGQTDENGAASVDELQQKSDSHSNVPVGETDDVKTLKNMLDELKREQEIYRNERNTNEKMLNESLSKVKEELSESIKACSEAGARAVYMTEKCKALAKRVQSQAVELEASEKRCANYVVTIGKLETNLKNTRDEALNALNKLSVTEVTLANVQQENQLLKDNERRMQMERNINRKEKHGQELLMANLEALKMKFESSEVEARMRLEKRLDDANVECTSLRRRLQEEQDRLTRRIELLEEQMKTAKQRLDEERMLKESIAQQLEQARQDVKEREDRIDEMSNQLTSAINKSQPVLDRENKIKELESQLRLKESSIEGLNEQLTMAKKCQQEFSEVSLGIEKQLTEVTEQYEQHKAESDKTISELTKANADLKASVHNLEIKLKTSNAAETESRVQREAEVTSLRSRVEALNKELDIAKTSLAAVEKEGQEATRRASDAQEKASSQVLLNDKLLTEMDQLRSELSDVKAELATMTGEKDRLVQTNQLEKEAMQVKIEHLESAAKASDEKIAELTKLNDLLQDQLQELGLKVSILDSSKSVGMEDMLENSLSSDTVRESDKMLEVMRFLRKEKSLAVTQAESLKAEKLQMQAEVEVLRKQLEESRKALETERQSSDTPSIAAERHAQLLSKVETLNQLTENNKSLREDRDRLAKRLNEVETELKTLDETVVNPSRKKTSELEAVVEQLQTEITALRGENKRWQDRANQLIERTNKNPDDLKRLTQEKENLTKQLGIERDMSKLAKQKADEQIAQLKREKDDSSNTLVSLEKLFNSARADLTTAKESEAKANETVAKLEQEVGTLKAQLTEITSKEVQIRQIAKKYKLQYQQLLTNFEEKNKAGPSTSEAEEKVKTLTEQAAGLETENETLRRENESLKASVVEREERAKTLLKNARSRVQHLQEENKTLIKEVAESRSRRGDTTTPAEMRIYENRISRLEKEKEEETAEKDRLGRELEVMTQRMNLIQRQLDKQQVTKPSTSSGEKMSNDPPTANIKPMAGLSAPTTKQIQPQQAVTVTPWRETPFASIRPMSQQARTVVVLPTSQSSSSNQPVLVAPQQQVVHTSSNCEGLSSSPTSSHIDCMPASSSAVHSIHQAQHTVIIGQHMEAEGVGCDEMASQPPTHHVQPNPNVSIALVLPQPTPQQQDQEQAEAVSAENNGVVSASNEEQESEQSVSASNHSTSVVGPTYYRSVDESSGPVASSQAEGSSSSMASVAASSQQAASSTTSVTTSVAPAVKRPMTSQEDSDCKHLPPNKRGRMMTTGEGSGEMLLRADGLEVEYQVPTSSQRDQEDDVLVISDEDDMPDDGVMEDGQEFEEEPEEESRYLIDAYGQDGQDMAMTSYEEGDGPDIDEGSTTDQDNNEVDIINDSNEVPNRCESSHGGSSAEGSGSGMEGVATTGGGEATSSLGSTTTSQYQVSRRPPSVPVRHHMILSYEDPGDDSIVPSTPTLFVPRRTDGYGEAVSSPHVPTARFTFTDSGTSNSSRPPVAGVAQVASEGMDDTRMDLSQLDEGTGRSVPTTPSHVSPQEPNPCEIGQSSVQDLAVPGGSETQESGITSDPASEQQNDTNNDDNGDGVSSETEKPLSNSPATIASPDPEEEGREAEASPTARSSTSSNTVQPASPMNPRSSSSTSSAHQQGHNQHLPQKRNRHPKSTPTRANAPTPIVWDTTEPTVSMAPMREVYFSGNQNRNLNHRNVMGRGIGSSGNLMELRNTSGRGLRRLRGPNLTYHSFHLRGSFQNQPR